jgi:hypothetical protein
VCSSADALEPDDRRGPAAERQQRAPSGSGRHNPRQGREKRNRPRDMSAWERLPPTPAEALQSGAGPAPDPLQRLAPRYCDGSRDRDRKSAMPARSERRRDGKPLQRYHPGRGEPGHRAGDHTGGMPARELGETMFDVTWRAHKITLAIRVPSDNGYGEKRRDSRELLRPGIAGIRYRAQHWMYQSGGNAMATSAH